MRLSIFVLPVLLAAVLACNSSSKKEEEKVMPGLKNGKINKQTFGNCDTTRNSGVSLHIKMWMPADSGKAEVNISRELNAKVVERVNSYADSASIAANPGAKRSAGDAYEVFSKNYYDFKKDFPDAPGCWEVDLKGDTTMVTPKILLYQLDHYAFTGGAHPNSFRSLHIFDILTGEEKEAGIFVADSVALLKKAEAAFRKLEKLDVKDNLEAKGYFLADHKFFLPANYTFTREGVLFYYNPYEIAPYVRGAIEFTIPYSELEGIVKKELIF
ncbi:DUF3298 and DUF4163 domain-containing protein [Dyadobacter psychrotolerans]|uniref:DUF3298 domain-containing protein n=1 Tax=Dyadobacter psychrotolerans TaxID=2541721 RepID=A0A4R5DUK7_9BACT|nr:DUF3298 and DUF4163 domain-containing protein [Dyadobacter psychrotolerans]TDE16174.1 DUF3298 domain-containing protein [Dyadobacter psychrotolerans]